MQDLTFSEDQVKEAWERYVTTGVMDPCIRPLTAESWLRCLKLGLDPRMINKLVTIEKSDLEQRIARNSYLLSIACPMMTELHSLVKGSGFLTMLTDCYGVILEMLSDGILRGAGLERNLVVGGVWTEEQAGTSAIGLAVLHRLPVQIIGAEHYFACDHDLTCSAAPVFNHTGELLGVLNMSGLKEQVHPHTLGMVVAASKAMTNQLRIEDRSHQVFISNQYLKTVIESLSDGIVAIDAKGQIREINSEAAKILASTVQEARGKDINKLLGKGTVLKRVMEDGKSIADVELVVDTERGRIHCYASAQPIVQESGRIVGAVATLKEIRKMHRVVNQIIGADARFTFNDIIGQSAVILRVKSLARAAGRSSSTVLIQGESGTGKELFAQAIHNASLPGQPFIAVNCAAIPETLIESELFGYDGGAFTGANRNGRPGKFELANGGTIFLDEIGEMPLNTQAVLLRVLQGRSIERVGGTHSIPVNVRIIAATNKLLASEVQEGNFRRDLYYRLNVFKLDIPPLRELMLDIPLLVEHFVSKIAIRMGKSIVGISPDALRILESYNWPGNIRQLENVIEHAINLVDGGLIEAQHFLDFLQEELSDITSNSVSFRTSMKLEEIEKKAMIDALRRFGERQRAARSLGISRSTLYRRLKKYGLEDMF